MLRFVMSDLSRCGVFTRISPSNSSTPPQKSHLFPLFLRPSPPPPFPSDSSHVLAVPGLVRPPLPAGVRSGAGGLRSVPVLPRARATGRAQVEQQNSSASPAGGQRELQR